MMGTVCVITARGGSKRIPRKNIRDFCGKPIILYSIEAALSCGLFDEVMVSTDDEEIAAIAQSCGASVPFMRSDRTSGDFATTAEVLLEVLDEYEKDGRSFGMVCCIYPTAPFVTPEKITGAISLYESSGADSVLTVTRFSFPPQRGLIGRDDRLTYWMPEYEMTRSQDIEPIFHDAGQLYLRRVSSLRETRSMVGPYSVGYEVPETEVQDIDNETDWQIAEMKYERMVGE